MYFNILCKSEIIFLQFYSNILIKYENIVYNKYIYIKYSYNYYLCKILISIIDYNKY